MQPSSLIEIIKLFFFFKSISSILIPGRRIECHFRSRKHSERPTQSSGLFGVGGPYVPFAFTLDLRVPPSHRTVALCSPRICPRRSGCSWWSLCPGKWVAMGLLFKECPEKAGVLLLSLLLLRSPPWVLWKCRESRGHLDLCWRNMSPLRSAWL